MYTVILYRNADQISIEKYKFMFGSFQEEQKIALVQWKTVNQVICELNLLTEMHHEWKLIIFDGKRALEQKSSCLNMDPEISNIIVKYTDMYDSSSPQIKGYRPMHVWYVAYREKGMRMADIPARLQHIDEGRRFGERFRMFWMELDCSCGMNLQYDLFRLNCVVLTLAINDIPMQMLECGFLYELAVEIDRDLFAEYVLRQEECLNRIELLLERETELLYGKKSVGENFPDVEVKVSVLEKCKEKIERDQEVETISISDLNNYPELKRKLDYNRNVVKGLLYFPKGVLKEAAVLIENWVNEKAKVGAFLNEAGLDRLNREKWDAFEQMCLLKPEQVHQKEVEDSLREAQEYLLQKSEKKLGLPMTLAVIIALTLVEFIILLPFLYYSLYPTGNNSVIVNAMVWLSGWAASKGALVIIILLLIFIEISFFYFVSIRLDDMDAVHSYKRHLKRVMLNDKLKYMEKMLGWISEYQFCIQLEDEQIRLQKDWELNRGKLNRHRAVWKNAGIVCQQLKHLIPDEAQSVCYPEVPEIEFGKEPQEIEYYSALYKSYYKEVELNRSGYYVRVIFDFVKRIVIMKTIQDHPI